MVGRGGPVAGGPCRRSSCPTPIGGAVAYPPPGPLSPRPPACLPRSSSAVDGRRGVVLELIGAASLPTHRRAYRPP